MNNAIQRLLAAAEKTISHYIDDQVELPDGRIFAVEVRSVDGRPASKKEVAAALQLAGTEILRLEG